MRGVKYGRLKGMRHKADGKERWIKYGLFFFVDGFRKFEECKVQLFHIRII